MRLFHATTREKAQAILANGVDFMAPRTRDPGDFGWGFYLTGDIDRARDLGDTILVVTIDPSIFATLQFPYFLKGFDKVAPTTEHERLFHRIVFSEDDRMKTVCGELAERVQTSKEVRQTFVERGLMGIITPYLDGETVVFDSSGIVSITLLSKT